MKNIFCIAAIVSIIAAGCVFPIQDTRTPTPAPTAWEGGPPQATAEAEAIATALETTPEPACVIKANISRTGEKIFHVPGQLNYERTIVDPESGEFWACSEQQAQELGWRKALK